MKWLPCPGFPGYEVSDEGQVRNANTLHVLSPTMSPRRGGKVCPKVGLMLFGRRYWKYVHRLVCEAFHGPAPIGKNEVNHFDGITTNPRASNLGWMNRSENERYKNTMCWPDWSKGT